MTTQKEIERMANSISFEKDGWHEWAKYVLMSLEDLKAQHASSQHKIDQNKDSFIQVINHLELTMSKEMSQLRSDLTVLKTRFAIRTVAWSSVIPGIVGAIILLLKYLN